MKLNIHFDCFTMRKDHDLTKEKVSSFILPEILVKIRE